MLDMPSRDRGAAPRVLMKEMAIKQQGDQQRTSAESAGAPRVSMKKAATAERRRECW